MWQPATMGRRATSFAIVAATAVQHARMLHVPPNVTPRAARKLSVADQLPINWTLGEPGASCVDVCGGWCNEALLQNINTEVQVNEIAHATGNPCSPGLPYGYTRFPAIDITDGSCTYLRQFLTEEAYSSGTGPVCGTLPDPPAFRLCFCSGRNLMTGWYMSGAADTNCDTVCASKAGVCLESETRRPASKEAVRDIFESLGFPCDDNYYYLVSEFPAQLPSGQCMIPYEYTPTCTLESATSLRRICPCQEVRRYAPDDLPNDSSSAYGDPHLTTLKGEKFDINNAGVSTFLLYPSDTSTPPRLRVDARIAHSDSSPRCRGWYITEMWVSGSAVGHEISLSTHGHIPDGHNSLVVRIGKQRVNSVQQVAQAMIETKYNMQFDDRRDNVTANHIHNRIKFAQLTINVEGAELEFAWYTGRKHLNSMNFRALHMKAVGIDWGGILGGDDHFWVSQPRPECGGGAPNAAKMPQLTNGASVWPEATASLD